MNLYFSLMAMSRNCMTFPSTMPLFIILQFSDDFVLLTLASSARIIQI
jgi:hypothetical protein